MVAGRRSRDFLDSMFERSVDFRSCSCDSLKVFYLVTEISYRGVPSGCPLSLGLISPLMNLLYPSLSLEYLTRSTSSLRYWFSFSMVVEYC